MDLGTENTSDFVGRRTFYVVTGVGLLLILLLAGALAVVVLSPETVSLEQTASKSPAQVKAESDAQEREAMEEFIGDEEPASQSDVDDLNSRVEEVAGFLDELTGAVDELDSNLSDVESTADDAASKANEACTQLYDVPDGYGC